MASSISGACSASSTRRSAPCCARGELHRAMALGATRKPTIALEEIRYLPTVPDPEKIICIGINYGNRNEEYKDGAEAPNYPSVFMRTPGSLVGHLEPIVRSARIRAARLRRRDRARDRQGGPAHRGGRRVEHVAGLTLMNEGSVRDWLRHSKFNVTPGKNFERSGSFGPVARHGRRVRRPTPSCTSRRASTASCARTTRRRT